MAEFPAMPLFTDAYLADTRHLTTEEHGAYLLLLIEAWRRPKCDLPDDDRILSRLTGLPMDRWLDVKPTIMAFWKRDGRSATFRQKRLSAERTYVAEKSRVNREKAAKRWNGSKKAYAPALPDECRGDAPTPTPTPTPISSSLRSEDNTAAAAAREGNTEAEKADSKQADGAQEPTFRERLLTAIGADPTSGMIGPNGTTIGTKADMFEAHRWISDLGLTEDECLSEVSSVLAKRRSSSPPRSFSFFSPAMADLAGAKFADPLTPTAGVAKAAKPTTDMDAIWKSLEEGTHQ